MPGFGTSYGMLAFLSAASIEMFVEEASRIEHKIVNSLPHFNPLRAGGKNFKGRKNPGYFSRHLSR
jgi:hypothetical protein